MVLLLLAPYNDSMRLGQGFNSFLQTPCIDDAVRHKPSNIRSRPPGPAATAVPQTVTYSSRFVERISDVVRGMNISAAATVKNGSVEVSGNSLSLDESKFADSDLNAVVSVKVVNEMTEYLEGGQFVPMEGDKISSESFFKTYGDCYISGFIYGGDLHGIVSIKVLSSSKRSQIESTLIGNLNGSMEEFTLSEGPISSVVSAALNQTETTITVSWSGGGQVKADNEEWTLESLFRVAAGFPARVAECPQRTWAILTKYDTDRAFLAWAAPLGVRVPHFGLVQPYAADLLDGYMQFKSHLAHLQAVLAKPSAYDRGPADDAIKPAVANLVKEKKLIHAEMRKIVAEIETLNNTPSALNDIETKSTIASAEIWGTRLPVLINAPGSPTSNAQAAAKQAIDNFPFFSADAAPAPQPAAAAKAQVQPAPAPAPVPAPEPLCQPADLDYLTPFVRRFVTDADKQRAYAHFRFGRLNLVPKGGGPFNDAPLLAAVEDSGADAWPTYVEVTVSTTAKCEEVVSSVRLTYQPQLRLEHGGGRFGDPWRTAGMALHRDERVAGVRMRHAAHADGFVSLRQLAVRVVKTHGSYSEWRQLGGNYSAPGTDVEVAPPAGFMGLKGFHGAAGSTIDALGPIWGR